MEEINFGKVTANPIELYDVQHKHIYSRALEEIPREKFHFKIEHDDNFVIVTAFTTFT